MDTEDAHGDVTPEQQPNVDEATGRPILDRVNFDCPICRSTSYWRVMWTSPKGQTVDLKLNQCSGCTVVFADAWRFKRVMRRSPDGSEQVTRGPDDRPLPRWLAAFWHDGKQPPGGFSKR